LERPSSRWTFSGAFRADVLAQLGRLDEVIAQTAAAVCIAEAADQPLTVVADAVEEFLRRQYFVRPALILLCAGTTCLSAGRIDEAALGELKDTSSKGPNPERDDRSAVIGTSA
jgi:hypothetical protein